MPVTITQVNYDIPGLTALQNSDLEFTQIFRNAGGLGMGGGSGGTTTVNGVTPVSNYIHTPRVNSDTGQEYTFFAGQTYTVSFDIVDRIGQGQDIGVFFLGYGDNDQLDLGAGSDDTRFNFQEAENVRVGDSYTFTFTPTAADLGGVDAIAGYFLIGETSTLSGNNVSIDNLQFNMTTCFARGTRINTPDGYRGIETLRVGDLVQTRDAGAQPITWVGVSRHTQDQMQRHVGLRSILIKQGALGANQPGRDLRVSRQHRILFSGPICEKMFGAEEILVPAIKLVALPGIEVERPSAEGVEYFHILLDTHHIVTSEGLESETFLPGPMALAALADEAKSSLYACIAQKDGVLAVEPARMIPTDGKRVHRFVERWANRAKRLQLH